MADDQRLLSTVDRALYLGGLPGLAEVEPDDLAIVAEQAQERFFRPAEVVLRGGDAARTAYVVVEGSIRVDGEGRSHASVGPRDTVGMLSLLARAAKGPDAVAETDTLTLAFDVETMREVLEDNFALLVHQMRSIAGHTLALRRLIPDGTFLATSPEPAGCPDRGLDLVERMVLLRGRGPFAQVSLDALADLATHLSEVRFERGERLWQPGAASGTLVTILSGVVRCAPEHGRTHFRCGPGYPLGNLESIAGVPRWFEAVAEAPVVGLRADTEVFLDLLEDHFDMAMDFLAAMAGNLIGLLEEGRAKPDLPA